MCRNVADCALALSVMAGLPDPRDNMTLIISSEVPAGKYPMDYTKFLNASGLQGARIGVLVEQVRWAAWPPVAVTLRACMYVCHMHMCAYMRLRRPHSSLEGPRLKSFAVRGVLLPVACVGLLGYCKRKPCAIVM
jgi:hypothetical protein